VPCLYLFDALCRWGYDEFKEGFIKYTKCLRTAFENITSLLNRYFRLSTKKTRKIKIYLE